jgi:predicted nucleic acid-binding protein
MTYVLDASALLRFLENEAGAIQVEALLKQAKQGDITILMSAVNWSEVLHYVLRKHGPAAMKSIESHLQSVQITILALDVAGAAQAAEFRYQHKIPFADAFAGTTAEQNQAVLITADYDFHALKTTFKIQLLPTKPQRKTP